MLAMPTNRVIVGGAGPAGMYAAIAAARNGFDVTVVEKFAEHAKRQTVLNLAPTVADALHRLGGDELTSALQTIVKRSRLDSGTGEEVIQNAGSKLIVNPDNPLNVYALRDGFTGVDSRPWSRIGVAGLENFLREYAARTFPDMKFLYGMSLDGIRQAEGSVTAHLVDGATGARQAIDGDLLISTTGGRNALGVKHRNFPEVGHFVGGLFEPTTADRIELQRIRTPGAQLAAATRHLNPSGQAFTSVGLPGVGSRELPQSLVWAQIGQDARNVPVADLRQMLHNRADLLGLGDLQMIDGDRSIIPVNVQLGLLYEHAAVYGRVAMAGDELLKPYFPTSTGASHALGVNGPDIDDLLSELRMNRVPFDVAMRQYDLSARHSAQKVLELGRAALLSDLGAPPRHWADGLEMAASGSGHTAP